MPLKLGIIAGGGRLPALLAAACESEGREFFVIALEGAADMGAAAAWPHVCVRLGAVGEMFSALKQAGVAEVVMAGGVKRPTLASFRPDAVAAKLVARHGAKLFFAGDDAALKVAIGALEEEGFRVIGADDVLGGLLAPAGVLTRAQPDVLACEDIAFGMKAAKALGARDAGQAVVVENGAVLGEEDAGGTDALIMRCGPFSKGRAILVKAKKPAQEVRADLPAVGPETIRRLHEARMMGVAVEAGGALLLDRAEMTRLADAYSLFVAAV